MIVNKGTNFQLNINYYLNKKRELRRKHSKTCVSWNIMAFVGVCGTCPGLCQ